MLKLRGCSHRLACHMLTRLLTCPSATHYWLFTCFVSFASCSRNRLSVKCRGAGREENGELSGGEGGIVKWVERRQVKERGAGALGGGGKD